MPELNADQQRVVTDCAGARSIVAGPGSGKTTTMVQLIHQLMNDGVSPSEIRAVTFSKEMAVALEKKLKVKGVASTFHSLGYLICSETERKPVEPELRHRLMCKLIRKWGMEYKELDHFIAQMRRENVSPADAMLRDHVDYGFASAYAMYEQTRAQEGWMDFDSMLADACALLEKPEVRARWSPKYLIVDEAQDTDTCHPPGTLIRKIVGANTKHHPTITQDVPIETLQSGDRVLAWNRRNGLMVKHTEPISVGVRNFSGHLIEIQCGTKKTQVTPDHQVYATMNGARDDSTYLVYLMYRSDFGFRVGQCAMRYAHNTPKKRKSMNGLGARFAEERAERGWVLRVCRTKEESWAWEQIISCNFGIPYATYGDKTYNSPFRQRNAALSKEIFANTKGRGEECLKHYHLLFEHPLFSRVENKGKKTVSKRYFITAACNLLPEIMSLPGTEPFTQTQVDAVTQKPYSGLVYSLNVPKHHTYVADGLVVKNCQWRMMQLMSERHGNITVVGDPNQAIYGFRGAKPDNITNFSQWFPTGRKFYLGKNYRSTQTIVKFVRENAPPDTPPELLERMIAARNVKGAPIGLKMYWTDDEEAESALKLTQADPLNSIILARTNRMVGLLERLCNHYNVRYHLMGKTGFWKRDEVRKAIEAMKDYPTSTTEAAFNLVMPALEKKYAVDDRTERDNDALENLKSLRMNWKGIRMAKDFVAYGNKMMHRRNDPHGVSISTIHQAKGGEWKNVYIIGANAKGFPHAKGDPQEERRIYFVAISRAIDVLRISFAGTPSPYLRRYLTEEILEKLREHAAEVDRLKAQTTLFF